MEDFENENAVTILSNTDNIQAVELVDRGYLETNFWSSTGGSVAGNLYGQSNFVDEGR